MKTKQDVTLDPHTQRNIDSWLSGQYDPETKAAIKKMLEDNPKEAVDAFYTSLSFGTGGLRGIMGTGSNRINRYTIRAATQGLANYILKQPKPHNGYSVFIGYDSRNHSREFAEETAKVMAGNGIRVYIFKEMRPTPLVSYGCRYKHCSAAVMITASHNPPEYNGYKVYWNDGAQILPPHDKNIISEVNKVANPTQVREVPSLDHPLVTWMGEEIDKAYLDSILPLQINPSQNKQEGYKLKIVYTSLHGSGITMVPKTLSAAGFTQVILVDRQVIPDGRFPTVKSPNPEEASALHLGIEKLKETEADLLIATDPDTDRIGVAVHHNDEIYRINGNQFACLTLHYILESLSKQNKLPKKGAFIKTIATTELFKMICKAHEQPCFDVLPGFKHIAEKIREWENSSTGYQFIFGGEESYGCMIGTQTRDKDAVTAALLISEIALQAKKQGKTLVDFLEVIYRKHGFYFEKLQSVVFEESREGKEAMKIWMDRLRNSLPAKILNVDVDFVDNYQKKTKTNLKTGSAEPLPLSESNILVFWLKDGSKVVVRPSGTEPKIKIYCSVVKKMSASLKETEKEADQYASALLQDLKNSMHKNEVL